MRVALSIVLLSLIALATGARAEFVGPFHSVANTFWRAMESRAGTIEPGSIILEVGENTLAFSAPGYGFGAAFGGGDGDIAFSNLFFEQTSYSGWNPWDCPARCKNLQFLNQGMRAARRYDVREEVLNFYDDQGIVIAAFERQRREGLKYAYWRVVSYADKGILKAVGDDAFFRPRFTVSGSSISGTVGCNPAMGDFVEEADGDFRVAVVLPGLASLCPIDEEFYEREGRIAQGFGDSVSASFQGDRALLRDRTGQPTLELEAASKP